MQVLLSFPKKFFIITGWTNKTSELIRLFWAAFCFFVTQQLIEDWNYNSTSLQ
jgi:hypothetical protein